MSPSEDAGLAADGAAAYPEGSVPAASATATSLAYDVVDAKFSAALGDLVIVSDTPSNTLHLYDVATGADVAIGLPTVPVAVAVDFTGLLGAVAYDAHVSWIDLRARTIKATCNLSSDANDVALTTSGVAYVAPETDQWVALHAIDLATCTETLESQLYAGARLALHPSQQVLFATQNLEPSSILRCDLTASPVGCEDAQDDANWGTYDFGNSVWASADGLRVYSGGAATLLVAADAGEGVYTYGGSLAGVAGVQSLSEAPDAGRVALIPSVAWNSPTNTDTVVRVHETEYLELVAQYELSPLPVGSSAGTAAHGRFVFSTAAMDALYVIVQLETEADGGGPFSVMTLVP